MQNKKYAGFALFTVVLFAALVSSASASPWIDKTGDAFSAPACGSSSPITSCNGTTKLNVSLNISGADQMYQINNWRIFIDGNQVCRFNNTSGSGDYGGTCGFGGSLSAPTWSGVLSNSAHTYELRMRGAHEEADGVTDWTVFSKGNIGALSCGGSIPGISGVSCGVSPTSIYQGGQAVWSATAVGGVEPLTYSWTSNNPEGPSGIGNPKTVTYNQTGIKSAFVTVSDSAGQTSGAIACNNSVNVNVPSGKTVNLNAFPSVLPQGTGDFTVQWNFASGGAALFDWIGMFRAGDGDSAVPVEWHYNSSGSDSGTQMFSGNYAPGNYNFRYFEATILGGSKLGTSNTVSIIPLTQCSDGVDNADPEDTLIDMADPGCFSPSDDDETNNIVTQCSDGVDNADAEDTLIDMADPGCSAPEDDDESNTVCGNGVVESGEICDAGSGNNGSCPKTCNASCTSFNVCGECFDLVDNDGDGFNNFSDPSCNQSGGITEYSACNDKNSDGTLRDNDGDGIANIFDPGCHSDGNTNNPASYDPNDNDESNTKFIEVRAPLKRFLAKLFYL